MLLKWLLLFSCSLFISRASAQSSPYKLFTSSEGLINNRSGSVSQDDLGYIWITTDNGICNYDGRKFNFFPGSRKQYYFAHNNYINKYKGACILGTDGQGFAKAKGNSLDFIYPKDSTPKYVMSGLQLNDSTYVSAAVHENKIHIITKNTIKYVPLPIEIRNLDIICVFVFEDVLKNVWVATNKGFVVYEKGDFNKPYVIPGFYKKYLNVARQDANHNIIVSSDSAMYYINAGSLSDVRKINPIKFYKHTFEITAVGVFGNGDIAFSTYPNGLLIFNKELKLVKKMDRPLIPDVILWDIFIDREGTMWLATENGIYKYTDLNIRNYTLPNPSGAPQVKTGICYGASFLLSNNLQIYNLEDGQLKLVNPRTENTYTNEFYTDGDLLWLNDLDPFNSYYQQKLYSTKFIKNSITTTAVLASPKTYSSSVNFKSIIKISTGDRCMLTRDGKLLRYTSGKFFEVKANPKHSNILFDAMLLTNVKDEAILISNDSGLYRIKFIQTNNELSFDILQHIKIVDKKIKCVEAILDNNGNIWLATNDNGLYQFSFEGNKYILKKHFTEPDISSILLTCIIKDSQGNLWLGSNKGIDKIIFSNNNRAEIYKGVYENNTLGNYIYVLREQNGILYIGSSGGLTTVPISTTLTKVVPFVYINKISCNGKEVDTKNINDKTVFKYDENNFTFEFVSPSFINESQTEYQYKMDGTAADWSSSSSNYTVNYNQLSPGNYTFRVRAKNANNLWSATDATFSFTIKKPFYNTWIFYLLCAIALCSFIYWLYRQKINKILAVEKTRSIISKDLHDDIGTTMSNLTLMNAILSEKIEKKPEEAKLLAKKMEIINRGMLLSMSDIVWSANPDNDSLEQLIVRLRVFCSNVFEDLGIHYNIIYEQKVKAKKLDIQYRKEIYLMCKEIISNCAKYSKAKQLSLHIVTTDKSISISAADDGVGFEEDKIVKGNGLSNIRKRVKALKGSAILNSTNGTQWLINIPT